MEVGEEELFENGDRIARQEDETREECGKVIERARSKNLVLVDYGIVPCVADILNIPEPRNRSRFVWSKHVNELS